jgi:hypothetical protein
MSSPSRRGDLVRSIWNTRAWTFQEYHASKVVRFYNKDWTLYRNLDIPNHKESPEIISEMEEATGVSARALMALRPGLEDIREKLRSGFDTPNDTGRGCSLLVAWNILSLLASCIWRGGQGTRPALGAATHELGRHEHPCMDRKIRELQQLPPGQDHVFNQLPTSHIPRAITSAEMETITAGLRASSVNLSLVTKLYDRLNELRVPLFAGKRMTLPCIAFKLGPLSISRSRSERVFRAQTAALGIVEIKTEEDLSRLDSLYLVHPWIDFLLDHSLSEVSSIRYRGEHRRSVFLDRRAAPSFLVLPVSTSAAPQTRTARLASRFGLSFSGRTLSPWRRSISSTPFDSGADGQTDARPPGHRSTETTIRCAVAHTEPWQRGSVQEGRFGESDHRPGRGDHADDIEQADRQRTRTGRALVMATGYTALVLQLRRCC